ncbi:hypothetical protein ACLEDP_00355 [Lonsdalea quercina]
MLYQHTLLKVLKALLGREKLEDTKIYTKAYALDMVGGHQV